MIQVIEVKAAIEREQDFDWVFVDTEFSRLPFDKEHVRDWARSVIAISVAVMPLGSSASFYAVQHLSKKLRAKCSEFVIAEVLPHVEAAEVTCRFSTALQFQRAFAEYFKDRKAQTGRPPLIVVDWLGDAFLLEHMLPDDAVILLLDQVPAVQRCLEHFFVAPLRRHNALHDAMALRQGYLDYKAEIEWEGV